VDILQRVGFLARQRPFLRDGDQIFIEDFLLFVRQLLEAGKGARQLLLGQRNPQYFEAFGKSMPP